MLALKIGKEMVPSLDVKTTHRVVYLSLKTDLSLRSMTNPNLTFHPHGPFPTLYCDKVDFCRSTTPVIVRLKIETDITDTIFAKIKNIEASMVSSHQFFPIF